MGGGWSKLDGTNAETNIDEFWPNIDQILQNINYLCQNSSNTCKTIQECNFRKIKKSASKIIQELDAAARMHVGTEGRMVWGGLDFTCLP